MIARKAILAFGAKLFIQAVGYVGVFFVARFMGPDALGTVSFGFAYVGVLGFLGDLGFGVAHIKKVSEGRDPPSCLGTFFAISSGLALVRAAVVVASVFILTRVINRPFESPAHETVIYLALITVTLYTVSSVMNLTFAARQKTAKQNLGDMVSRLVETSMKVVVAVAGMGVVLLADAAVVGAVVSLLVSACLFRGTPVAKPTWAMAREYIAFAMPVTIIVSANAITENLDKIMIQIFWTSTEVGHYTGAGKIAQIIALTGIAMGMLVFPAISALHGKNDLSAIRDLTLRAERYAVMLLLPLGVLIVSLRRPIIRLLLGEDFLPAADTLAALTFSTIVYVASTPYSAQIIGTNRPYLSAILSVVLMTTNVLLNLLLVPRTLGGLPMLGLGASGAAAATLTANLVMAGIYRLCAHRATGTRATTDVFKILAAAAIMAGGLHAFFRAVEPSGVLAPCLGVCLGLSLYVGALLALRGLTRRDVEYLLRTVSPRRMKDYVFDEIRKTGPSSHDGEDQHPR